MIQPTSSYKIGADLFWDDKDMIRFGNCGSKLEELVQFTIPPSDVAVLPGSSFSYVLFEPGFHLMSKIPIPEGETGYAVEYKSGFIQISRDEAIEKLFEWNKERNPDDSEERAREMAEAMYDHSTSVNHIGTSFAGDVTFEDQKAYGNRFDFLRWVDKEEFAAKAKWVRDHKDVEGVHFGTRWDSLEFDEKQADCFTCPLSMYVGEQTEEPQPHTKYTCYMGSSHSHWRSFIRFIQNHASFSVITETNLVKGGGISVGMLHQLQKELMKSRKILEGETIPGINFFDADGQQVGTFAYQDGVLGGNHALGYGMGIDDQPGIVVRAYEQCVWDIPQETRADVLGREGLSGLYAMIKDKEPLRVRSIEQTDDTYVALTMDGETITLPILPHRMHGTPCTPFDGYNQQGNVFKVEYTEVPAMEGFGYLQKLLEKTMIVGKRFQIPIHVSA